MIGSRFDLKGEICLWTKGNLTKFISAQQYNVVGFTGFTMTNQYKKPYTGILKNDLAEWAKEELEDSDLIPLMKKFIVTVSSFGSFFRVKEGSFYRYWYGFCKCRLDFCS